MARQSLHADGLYRQAHQRIAEAKDNARWAASLAPDQAHIHKLVLLPYLNAPPTYKAACVPARGQAFA